MKQRSEMKNSVSLVKTYDDFDKFYIDCHPFWCYLKKAKFLTEKKLTLVHQIAFEYLNFMKLNSNIFANICP